MWIFAYGSLVWKPGFDHLEKSPAVLQGWKRRFWQGSIDHRGIPGAPGRVLTLIEGEGQVLGFAFRIDPATQPAVRAYLDHRESGGYEASMVHIELTDGRRFEALTYIAHPHNPNFLGHAPDEAIAAQIRTATGPSGANTDYVLELYKELEKRGYADNHLTRIARLLDEEDQE